MSGCQKKGKQKATFKKKCFPQMSQSTKKNMWATLNNEEL